jgi:hypothetical protein
MPRFLTTIRIDERTAPPGGSGPELQRRMGVLLEEMTKAGAWWRPPVSRRARRGVGSPGPGGRISYSNGPFTESKEVIGGYAILRCADEVEALAWTGRFLRIDEEHWTMTTEVRETIEM